MSSYYHSGTGLTAAVASGHKHDPLKIGRYRRSTRTSAATTVGTEEYETDEEMLVDVDLGNTSNVSKTSLNAYKASSERKPTRAEMDSFAEKHMFSNSMSAEEKAAMPSFLKRSGQNKKLRGAAATKSGVPGSSAAAAMALRKKLSELGGSGKFNTKEVTSSDKRVTDYLLSGSGDKTKTASSNRDVSKDSGSRSGSPGVGRAQPSSHSLKKGLHQAAGEDLTAGGETEGGDTATTAASTAPSVPSWTKAQYAGPRNAKACALSPKPQMGQKQQCHCLMPCPASPSASNNMYKGVEKTSQSQKIKRDGESDLHKKHEDPGVVADELVKFIVETADSQKGAQSESDKAAGKACDPASAKKNMPRCPPPDLSGPQFALDTTAKTMSSGRALGRELGAASGGISRNSRSSSPPQDLSGPQIAVETRVKSMSSGRGMSGKERTAPKRTPRAPPQDLSGPQFALDTTFKTMSSGRALGRELGAQGKFNPAGDAHKKLPADFSANSSDAKKAPFQAPHDLSFSAGLASSKLSSAAGRKIGRADVTKASSTQDYSGATGVARAGGVIVESGRAKSPAKSIAKKFAPARRFSIHAPRKAPGAGKDVSFSPSSLFMPEGSIPDDSTTDGDRFIFDDYEQEDGEDTDEAEIDMYRKYMNRLSLCDEDSDFGERPAPFAAKGGRQMDGFMTKMKSGHGHLYNAVVDGNSDYEFYADSTADADDEESGAFYGKVRKGGKGQRSCQAARRPQGRGRQVGPSSNSGGCNVESLSAGPNLRRNLWCIAIVTAVLGALTAVLAVMVTLQDGSLSTNSIGGPPLDFSTHEGGASVLKLLSTVSPVSSLEDPTAPQHMAVKWLMNDRSLQSWLEASMTSAGVGIESDGTAVKSGQLAPGPGQFAALEREVLSRYAVATFFYSSGGPLGEQHVQTGFGWTRADNWLSPKPICEWYGLVCASDRVVGLKMQGNNLNGPLPNELLWFTFLEKVNLSNNQITGPLPQWLGELSNLSELRLSNNRLNGSIEIGAGWNSRKLEVLLLDGNLLEGTVPDTINKLQSLYVLRLSSNHLTGDVPPALGHLQKLYELDISSNSFQGAIPDDISNLVQLRELKMGSNGLRGSVPDTFAKLVELEVLHLYDNGLSGEIPSWIGSLGNLRSLRLEQNFLTGSPPSSMGSMSDLEELTLEENDFSGKVPDDVCTLHRLRVLSADCSQLSCPCCTDCYEADGTALDDDAPPPPSLQSVGSNLDADSEFLDESHEPGLELVFTISDPNAFLDPSSPQSMALLWLKSDSSFEEYSKSDTSRGDETELGIEVLQRYAFAVLFHATSGHTGAWSDESGWLTDGHLCDWYGVSCVGSGEESRIEGLSLSGNNLHGQIPSELKVFMHLSMVDMSENNLSGIVPESLGYLGELQALSLHQNQLSGTVPQSLCSLNLYHFSTDCLGNNPKISCPCCTECFQR